MLRDLLDRLLYLFAFGFGMGAVIPSMGGLPYLTFITPGMAAATGLQVVSMAMSYGVWERANAYRVWQAWLATPVRLSEILLAELLYAALRALPSVLILLLLVGSLFGAVPSVWGALLALPVIMLGNLAIGAITLCFTAHLRRTMHFAYLITLWVTPQFLFSGVFFDITHTPGLFQAFANIFPLTHIIDTIRPLMVGGQGDQPIHLFAMLGHVLVLAILFAGAYRYALWRFEKRLLD